MGEIRLKMIKELAQDQKMAKLGFGPACQTSKPSIYPLNQATSTPSWGWGLRKLLCRWPSSRLFWKRPFSSFIHWAPPFASSALAVPSLELDNVDKSHQFSGGSWLGDPNHASYTCSAVDTQVTSLWACFLSP